MMEAAIERNHAQAGTCIGLNIRLVTRTTMSGHSEWIKRRTEGFSIYHFVAAPLFARAGLKRETKASVAEFLRLNSGFFDNFDTELAMRNVVQEIGRCWSKGR